MARFDMNLYLAEMEIKTISDANVGYTICPRGGDLKRINVLVDASVDADTNLTFSIDGVAVTGGVVKVLAADAAGVLYTVTPTALTAIGKGSIITAVSAASGAVTANAIVSLEIEA